VAGARGEGRKGRRVLTTSLMVTLAVGATIVLALWVAPASIWTMFFGRGFVLAGRYGLPYLMVMYAVTTVVYSLCVVFITYEMSYRIANTSWVQLAFAGVIIAGITRFHASLQEVIWVQLAIMVVLLVVVALPFVVNVIANSRSTDEDSGVGPVIIVRRASEDEVIAEFLKSDFNSPAFHEYRHALRDLVMTPDYEDAGENAKRRALLFIRHLALWKELPGDTKWYEVELRPSELRQVRVFPRAQWRKLARGNFSISTVADRVRGLDEADEGSFRAKIGAIQDRLLQQTADPGAVVLIGVSERDPLTILDGNHRLVAAMLAGPGGLSRLRFFCGLSPRMTECCWYNTNLVTLTRYAKNVLTHIVRDPEAELARLLQSAS
jgi:hypothetical protein